MKYLVVYSSPGGNTRKLAEELFKQIPEENKEIAPVKEAPDPGDYDVVCVGFWIKAGQPDPDSQEYLKKCRNKVFLFATHGAAPDSEHAKTAMNKAVELAEDATVIGCFSCQGEVPEKVIENASQKVPPPGWLDDAPSAKGHPDSSDFVALSNALVKAGIKPEPQKDSGPPITGDHAM